MNFVSRFWSPNPSVHIRWFHLTCLPAEIPGSLATGIGSFVGGQWFHCKSCRVLQENLRLAVISNAESRVATSPSKNPPAPLASAASAVKPLLSVSLLDLGVIRRSRRRDAALLGRRVSGGGIDVDEESDRVHGLLCGASAQRDLSAVARIFSRAHPSPGVRSETFLEDVRMCVGLCVCYDRFG